MSGGIETGAAERAWALSFNKQQARIEELVKQNAELSVALAGARMDIADIHRQYAIYTSPIELGRIDQVLAEANRTREEAIMPLFNQGTRYCRDWRPVRDRAETLVLQLLNTKLEVGFAFFEGWKAATGAKRLSKQAKAAYEQSRAKKEVP